jgi:VanZ family protein
MKRFLRYHLPALLYAAIILSLSSLPRADLPDLAIMKADKLLHFAEYSLFAVLIYRSMADLLGRLRSGYIFWVSLVIVMVFAAFDEYYQSYIPGRDSDPLDLLIDIMGATLILFLLWYSGKRKAKSSEL